MSANYHAAPDEARIAQALHPTGWPVRENPMTGLFLFAFVGGVVATVNPCGFALLPAYLMRRIHPGSGTSRTAAVLRAITVGATTTAGFIVVFGIVGGLISAGVYGLMPLMPWAGFLVGIANVVAGLLIIAGRVPHFRIAPPHPSHPVSSRSGDFLFGVGYGVASLSCTLPIFLSVTGTAITGSFTVSLLTFLSYAAGMGTVLMTLAVAATTASRSIPNRFRPLGSTSNRISGAMLILSGVYITYYWGSPLLTSDIPSDAGIIAQGERVAGVLRAWLGGPYGEVLAPGLAAGIFVFLIRVVVDRGGRSKNLKKPDGPPGLPISPNTEK